MDDTTDTPAPRPGVECLECGTALSYAGHGRRPRYCSAVCRHRGWEKRRAAADGLIATQVVEMPRPPAQAPLDRDTVATWLAQRPGRMAGVLAALPDTTESEKALCAALNRIRPAGRTPEVLTDLERAQSAAAERWQRLAHEREHHLRDEVDRWRTAAAHEHPSAARSGPSSAAPGDMPATQLRGETSATEAGMKVVEVGGKSFRVPSVWTRQQFRQWCRDHPDQALD